MTKRNRKVRIFESAIERVARVLSRKWKVRVVFEHNRCETCGNVIYLPTLPDNASKELMDAMQGHLDHEASHVVHTNFKAVNKVARKPKTMTVLNALEDPRIEKLWCAMYPGAKVNLRRSQEFALKKTATERKMVDPEDGVEKMMRPWDGLSDLGKFLHASITYATEGFTDSHWFLQDVVEPEILNDVKKFSHYWEKALAAKDTAELVPLAEELLEKLGEEDHEQPEGQGEGQGEIPEDAIMMPPGSAPPQRSPQSSVMQKQPKNQPQGPQMVEMIPADPGQDQQDASQQQQSRKGGDYSSVTDEDVQKDQEIANREEALRDAANQELSEHDTYLVYSTEGDQIERIKDGDRMAYKRFMTGAVKYVAPMKRRMSRSMLATAQARWEGDKTRGKLNPRRIYQVPMGTSKRVFRQRVEAEAFDTAVLLMVDHSGSMHGYPLDLAAKTSIVFGELLHQLNIPFAVYGFSTGCSSVSYDRFYKATPEEQRLYKRWGNLWLGEYKSWDDGWQNSAPKLVTMLHNSQHNTYDGEALRTGAQMLLARPEKRKIMFWLNDGAPCPNGVDDSEAHRRYAKDCAREVEKMIELFAIGINTDAVKQYYSNCVVVNNLEDLPKTCLGELDALIRKGKTYR